MQHTSVKIPYKYVVTASYLYMVLPIVIFFLGWLKVGYGILFSGMVLIGMVWILREQFQKDEKISLPLTSVLLFVLVILIWAYGSGVGGFCPQKADWHWRNAILRDLIDYSWPVVYPDTGNAMVYYISYFLVPALAGKVFGWQAANVILLLWTIAGLNICILLLCRRLGVHTTKHMIVMLMVFLTWRGFDSIRSRVAEVLGVYGPVYEYTPNQALLEWVTNQTIVPWIAVLLFLNDRNLKHYAYLGLCVLASAPFPFLGLFVLLAVDGIDQLYHVYEKHWGVWCRKLCSIQNIMAVFSIIPVYGLYFFSNTAANGSYGEGGFGFYIEPENFTMIHLLWLFLFYFFNFLIFSVIIYADYKKDILFYTLNLSLFLIPIFRLGEGRDFCMRVSIPALFLLMVYTAEYINRHAHEKLTNRFIFIIAAFGIFVSQFLDESCIKYLTVKNVESRDDFWADEIYTFANKSPQARYLASNLRNFLLEKPYQSSFFFRTMQCKDRNGDRKGPADITGVC